MTGGWRVGIDVGGTFTDIVGVSSANDAIRTAKVRTRTDDRIAGVLAALSAIDLEWEDVSDLIHGTTIITNAVVEDKLPEVALITTSGFSDTIEIGRQNRRYLYRLDLPPKVKPQVPAERRFEVDERLDHHGEVLVDLDITSVDRAIEAAKESGAKAVAVSLIHAYANPEHEETLGRHLREGFPYVSLSHQVNPETREYERTATTVLNASVMPLAGEYLDQLKSEKPEATRLHLFHSAGGMASPDAMCELPLGLALSGPAAGVAAASDAARTLGLDYVISFDMGGTTTDVCMISNGFAEISSDRSLGGRPIRQPMAAVESIGAGGGSIARLDHGALCVGPESAGADPGPACYGRGGTLPTVSDANMILGYIDAERVLGDDVHLDVAAARTAVAPLAEAMNMEIEAVALGILRVTNAAMVRAMQRITVGRGIDGRRCTLIAFGGAGPMHAVEIARAMEISRVLVPANSSVFSALGCVQAEMSYSRQQTVRMASDEWDEPRLDYMRRDMRARLIEPLISSGHTEDSLRFEEIAAVRYKGQSYAIEIPDPDYADPDALRSAFIERHHHLYGFATDEPWEIVAIRQRAYVPRPNGTAWNDVPKVDASGAYKMSRCTFDGIGQVDTPRYQRNGLIPEQSIDGPAIVEDSWSTVVVPPEAVMTADEQGNLTIDTGATP